MLSIDKEILEIRSDENHLFVYWILTDWCNFSCSYCPKHLHDGRNVGKEPPLEDIIQFCDKLNSYIEKGKKIEITLGGGEPTTYKNIIEIIERLHPNIWISIITNGSRPLAWWEKVSSKLDHVIISVHKESNLERIDENSKYLISKNIDVVFNCTFDPEDWDDSIKRYNFFEKEYGTRRARKKLINELDPITDNYLKPKRLSKEQEEFMKDPIEWNDRYFENWKEADKRLIDKISKKTVDVVYTDSQETIDKNPFSFQMTHHNLNHFYNWECSAGKEGICVDPLGLVYAGACVSKFMGYISNFELLEKPIICKKLTCGCLCDIVLSKKKVKHP